MKDPPVAYLEAQEFEMNAAPRAEGGVIGTRVVVSSAAANMISSLHPFDTGQAMAALEMIKSSVLDPAKTKKITGVDDAFVARAGDLRVIFKKEDDAILITSVVAYA